MIEYQLYVDGEFCEASDGNRFTSTNPATGEKWATAPGATEVDVDRAVRAARRALIEGDWPTLTATERGRLLSRLADLVAESAHHLGSVETTDSGKLAAETRAQSAYVADYYRYYAGLADKIQGDTLPIDKPDLHVYTTREPVGVVAAIVPWNAEMFLTATKVGPALAAGNTVVIKASEVAPAPLLEFARVVDKVGFPPGVINLITGFGEPCGRSLTSHPLVDKVAFTGGVDTARNVVANTAHNLAPVTLELGGKSPILVFDDADFDGAVNGAVAGNFGASGQSCVAGSRVFVQSGIYDKFVAEVVHRAESICIGDPLADDTQMGPLATQAQRDRCESVVAESAAQGAIVHTGGCRPIGLDNGWYYRPTVLGCPDQKILSTQVEIFGPVMSVLRFDAEDEAVNMANDTEFGLGAGIFTNDVARVHRVSKAIRSGIVWVNTYRAVSPIAPFGGFGLSGSGREAGVDAIHEFTTTKTIWINTSAEPMVNPFTMR
ncbi:MAG: carnitine dehydratase [Acidimicrobiaceae bacterium]|nr:carnitine dehydratase [Acidimicrobiaceae bacterium]